MPSTVLLSAWMYQHVPTACMTCCYSTTFGGPFFQCIIEILQHQSKGTWSMNLDCIQVTQPLPANFRMNNPSSSRYLSRGLSIPTPNHKKSSLAFHFSIVLLLDLLKMALGRPGLGQCDDFQTQLTDYSPTCGTWMGVLPRTSSVKPCPAGDQS